MKPFPQMRCIPPLSGIRSKSLLLGVLFIMLCSAAACTAQPEVRPAAAGSGIPFTLTVGHLNDTHSHWEETPVKVGAGQGARTITLGGLPRIASIVESLRRDSPFLLLHAGDAFQGTLYFTRFQGAADWDFLNLLRVDAMTFGNHEFDKGPELAAKLVDNAKFPLLAANVDVSRQPGLAGKVPPSRIFTFNGEAVGVIGLACADSPRISNPGGKVMFTDPMEAVKREVTLLKGKGIDKIIVLSHNGYEFDRALAGTVSGIDIIVGGHSHTLLGGNELKGKGLFPRGAYPTVIEDAEGEKTLVVTAWEWGKVVGFLKVGFDGSGRIAAYEGRPVLVDEGVPEDQKALRKLREYKSEVDSFGRQVVAVAEEHLPRSDSRGNPLLGRIVADSMLWKARSLDPSVMIGLVNAGGIRADLPRGDVTVASAVSVLPFDNTLVIADLSGRELLAVLDESVKAHAADKIRGSLIPAGLRYRADIKSPAGQHLLRAEVLEGEKWQPVEPDRIYRVVTNSYMASGGDYGNSFKNASGYRSDTAIIDSDAFIEYLRMKQRLSRPAQPDPPLSLYFQPPSLSAPASVASQGAAAMPAAA